MRKKIFLAILSFTALASCDLGGESYVRNDVYLPIVGYNFPDTVVANTPFNIHLRTKSTSSCEFNLRFYMARTYDTSVGDSVILVSGLATYESHDYNCSSIVQYKDSTFTVKLKVIRKQYFYINTGDEKLLKDSIIVIEHQ